MWKRLGLVLVAVGLLATILMPCRVAQAATSDDVTVTAMGYICGAPGGFTVTYISDYEVGLSWTKGEDAQNTMVRACIGREPTDRSDGYEVYYGTGTYATDWVNMETLSVPVYYRAWSQRADGLWEESGSESGWVEGVSMILWALIALALGLTITAYAMKRGALFFGAAGAWVILCGYSYTRATSTSDIYFFLFLLCGALVIVSAVGALTTRETKSVSEPEEDEDIRDVRETMEEVERERQQYSFLNKDFKRHPRRGRLSRYERTKS